MVLRSINIRDKKFSDDWSALIHNFFFGESVANKVNDEIEKYFQTKKELRQDDPLSPMLLNIVVGSHN
jgi:hypothetical protein